MIQLPKDADGREIPLDTKVLYGSGGTARNIVYWVYTVDSDLEKEWGNCWRAVTDAGRKLDAELMYLTEPDSWEKLEEDLDSCSASTRYAPCAYFSFSSDSCEKCPADPNKECLAQMVKHIALRIHKLRGES